MANTQLGFFWCKYCLQAENAAATGLGLSEVCELAPNNLPAVLSLLRHTVVDKSADKHTDDVSALELVGFSSQLGRNVAQLVEASAFCAVSQLITSRTSVSISSFSGDREDGGFPSTESSLLQDADTRCSLVTLWER